MKLLFLPAAVDERHDSVDVDVGRDANHIFALWYCLFTVTFYPSIYDSMSTCFSYGSLEVRVMRGEYT